MRSKDKIIVALDVDSPGKALILVKQLGDAVGSFKIGLEFITAMIVSILLAPDEAALLKVCAEIRELFHLLKGRLFWDGKFCDIPNTVGAAAKVLGPLETRMFNVHASSGISAMAAAVKNRALSDVLAVTVLTSIDENNAPLTFGVSSKAAVLQFARNALLAGCTGLINSPQELSTLDENPELANLKRVTPGIRSSDAPPDDQKRTMTPREAMRYGANELVIGRPITQAKSSVEAAQKIAQEMSDGLRDRFHAVLFRLQKIKFGDFRLKLHDTNPDAPLSPIYLDIRGLPDWLYATAGDILHDLIVKEGLIGSFDYVIGIPKAGEPIGKALAKAVGVPFLRMEKIEGDGVRKITSNILDPFEKGKRVLLIDDLITKAHTKLEAIQSIEVNGLEVAATCVLYDREQGGLAELNQQGRKVYAANRLSEALDFFVRERSITPEKKAEVIAYVAAN